MSFSSEIFPVSASIVRCSFIFVFAAVCAAKLEVRGRHAGIWEVVPEQIVFGTFWSSRRRRMCPRQHISWKHPETFYRKLRWGILAIFQAGNSQGASQGYQGINGNNQKKITGSLTCTNCILQQYEHLVFARTDISAN